MESFSKRSANVFDALDKLDPLHSKDTAKSSPPVDKEFRRPREIYRPPAKRIKTSPSHSHSRDSPSQSEHKHTHTQADHDRRSSTRHHRESYGSDRRHRTHKSKDPAKWTKYDLREDGTKQMTGLSDEQVNRRVAYQFLDQLKKRNQPQDEPVASDAKIVFKKPARSKVGAQDDSKTVSKKASKLCIESDNLSAGAGVRVMPEYVVGVGGVGKRKRPVVSTLSEEKGSESESASNSKPESVRTKTTLSKQKQSAVSLSHLDDFEN